MARKLRKEFAGEVGPLAYRPRVNRGMNMRISNRTRCEGLIVCALLLGSSGNSAEDAYSLADVVNANPANALSLCDDLDSRVSDIEWRLNM